MYLKITLSAALFIAALFGANTKTVSLHIPDEMAPPGGMVQMKLMVTEPTPIATGSVGFAFDSGTFSGVFGISLFNLAGDVNGAVVIQGNQVNLRYTTTTGTSGTDYPIMSFALGVRADALPGQKTQFALDPSSVWLLDLFGPAFLKPIPPANITVGGSISITDVTPGGGFMQPGSVVKVIGMGFQPKTQVQVSAVKLSSVNIVSPQEIDLTIAEAVQMTGKKIQVVNPDGSQDTYFSYMRGVALGASNEPLLAATVPVFSSKMHSQAVFLMPSTDAGQFTGLAVQNQNLDTVSVTVSAYALTGALLGTANFDLPPAMRITREVQEWISGAGQAQVVTVSSSEPVQVFGLFGDTAASSVVPFRAVFARP